MNGVRLQWADRRDHVERVALPLQVVETVNVSRAAKGTLDEFATQDDDWRNRLIWGDNKYVLASLAEEFAGQVDLVYIDPPFDSRQDYKVKINVGEGSATESLAKIQSIIEEKAYRDTWGAGVDSYVQMLYDRLVLLHELLSERGSIFLHLAPNVSHLGRLLLDEIFGASNFRTEIAWKRTTAHPNAQEFAAIHDNILVYSKTQAHLWIDQYEPYDDEFITKYFRFDDGDGRLYWPGDATGPGVRKGSTGSSWRGFNPGDKGRHWTVPVEELDKLDANGRIYWPKKGSGFPQLKRYLDEAKGMPIGDLWSDIKRINQVANERLGYDTQKPEALLDRIIKSSSDEDSIVLDCFVGSGTAVAVAEKLGRRWIGCDIGRFAIHTTRKRLLDIQNCRPFLVGNLGRYERQVWQAATTGEEQQAYLDFILELYRATPLGGHKHLHGTFANRAVHIGAVDAPVTFDEISRALDECTPTGFQGLDVLGWEWELGLNDVVQNEARERGVDLRLRHIPREVMDSRAVVAGDIVFHELAYVEVTAAVKGRDVTVSLDDFVLPNPDLVPDSVRDKIAGWSDYIDYWAVDFAFGGDTFHNQWQSYRTRQDPKLETVTTHRYDEPGEYTVLVKVFDIFGNDTTTAKRVTVS